MANPEKIEFEYQISMDQLEDYRAAYQHLQMLRNNSELGKQYIGMFGEATLYASLLAGLICTLIVFLTLYLQNIVIQSYAFVLIPIFILSCIYFFYATFQLNKHLASTDVKVYLYNVWKTQVLRKLNHRVAITPECFFVQSGDIESYQFTWIDLKGQMIEKDNYSVLMEHRIFVIPKDALPMPAEDISKLVDGWSQDWLTQNKDSAAIKANNSNHWAIDQGHLTSKHLP